MQFTVTITYRDGTYLTSDFDSWTVLQYLVDALEPYRWALKDIHVNCSLRKIPKQ
jgi:hypothetical protein